MLKELLTMFTVRQVNTMIALISILVIISFPVISFAGIAKTSAAYVGISALVAYVNH